MPEEFKPASTVPIRDMLLTHPCYRPDLIQKYRDFYEGGESFEKNKDKYLARRAIEGSSTGGNAFRKARMEAAYYTPHAAGLIDWLVSACMQSQPAIMATGDEKKCAYYNALNKSADGAQDLVALAMSRLLEVITQHRAYFSLVFPNPKLAAANNADQQKTAGDLDAKICALDAKDIDDWECTEDETLVWVRTHTVEYTRSRAFGPRDMELHRWVYFTDKTRFEYQAQKRVDETTWNEKAVATLTDTSNHTLNALPVVPIRISKGMWLMHRMYPVALGLFNREASEDHALNSSALAVPVFICNEDINEAVLTEQAAIHLKPGGDYKWSAPPGGHWEALEKNSERKRENLYLSVQNAAQLQAGKPDSGRASGVAKKYDGQKVAVLLYAFANALRDSLEHIIEILKSARGDGDEIKVVVTGLDSYDVEQLQTQVDQITSFFSTPGGIPKAARNHVLQNVSLNMCADATPAVKQAIEDDIENGNLVMPPLPAPAQALDANGVSAPAGAVQSSGTGGDGLLGDVNLEGKLKTIDSKKIIQLHDVDPKFKDHLKASMQAGGYDESKPILSVDMPSVGKGASLVLDGHHRSAAANELGLKIPSWQISEKEYHGLLMSKFKNVQPDSLSDLDQFVSVKHPQTGKTVTYDQVRTRNEHTNGAGSGAASGQTKSQ